LSHLKKEIKFEPEKFKGQKMPEPVTVLTLSWEDVYGKFCMEGIDPTKEMIEEAFEIACHNADNEYMMGGFWANIEYAISEVSVPDEDDEK